MESFELKNNREKQDIEADRLQRLHENGVFSINGLEVVPKEKLVKFPEHLVQETGGVEGYVRRELTWEDVEDLYSQIIPTDDLRHYIDLILSIIPDTDRTVSYYLETQEFSSFDKINSLESLNVFFRAIGFLESLFMRDGIAYEYRDDFLRLLGDDGKVFEGKIFEMNKVFRDMLFTLSDNGLRNEGLHVMGLYHPVTSGHEDEFTQKMLLQKIYNPEDYSSLVPAGTKDYGYNTFSFVDGKVNFINRFRQLKEEGDEEYRQRLLDSVKHKNAFLMHNFGLNVSSRGIWDLDKNPGDFSLYMTLKPIFGFGDDNEVYKRYVLSVKKLFEENPEVKEAFEADKDPFYFNTRPSHPLIPVILGHPDIPDLRWCHASHAYIPTKNGINILKMISSKEEMENEKKRLEDKNSNNGM